MLFVLYGGDILFVDIVCMLCLLCVFVGFVCGVLFVLVGVLL